MGPRKCQICDPWETFIQLRARVWQKAVKYLMNESMARMRAQLKRGAMVMNMATAVVLAILIVCVCLSVRLMMKKGMCGEKEMCGSCSGRCGGGCSATARIDKMIADADAAVASAK